MKTKNIASFLLLLLIISACSQQESAGRPGLVRLYEDPAILDQLYEIQREQRIDVQQHSDDQSASSFRSEVRQTYDSLAERVADFGIDLNTQVEAVLPMNAKYGDFTRQTMRSGLLHHGSRLTTSLEIPRNANLQLSLCVPVEQLSGNLLVAVDDEIISNESLSTLPINIWQQRQIDFSRYSGKTVELTIEFSGDGQPASLIALAEPIFVSREGGESKSPNLILISLDTLRADAVAPWDDGSIAPFMKELAENAYVFERLYTQSCWTTNSHQSMLSGLFPQLHNVISGDKQSTRMPQAIDSLAEILAENGYLTAAFTGGKAVSANRGFYQGFDLYVDATTMVETKRVNGELLATSRIGFSEAKTWLQKQPAGQPLFLFLHTYAAHDPYVQPPEYHQDMVEIDSQARSLFAELDQNVRSEKVLFAKFDNGQTLSPAEVLYLKNRYLRGVRYLDDHLRDLWAEFERLGLLENSIIVITSDHGEEFYEHNSLRHVKLYDTNLHVPLYVILPKADRVAGQVIEDTVRGVDIMPTILELLGHELAEFPFLHGTSLVPLMLSDQLTVPETSMISFVHEHGLRTPSAKFIRQESGAFEFYNLISDPEEVQNLFREQADANQLSLDRILLGLADCLPGWSIYIPENAGLVPPFTVEIQGITASPRNAETTQALYQQTYPGASIHIGETSVTVEVLPTLINIDGLEEEEIELVIADKNGANLQFSCQSANGDVFADIDSAVIHPEIRERFFSFANLHKRALSDALILIAYNNFLNAVLDTVESTDKNQTIENELRNLGYLQ